MRQVGQCEEEWGRALSSPAYHHRANIFFGYVGSTKNLTFEYVGSTLRSDGLGLRVDYNDYVGNLHGMMMKRWWWWR